MAQGNFFEREDWFQSIKDGCYLDLSTNSVPTKIKPYFSKVPTDFTTAKITYDTDGSLYGAEGGYYTTPKYENDEDPSRIVNLVDKGRYYVLETYGTGYSEQGYFIKINEADINEDFYKSIIEEYYNLRFENININVSWSATAKTAFPEDNYTSTFSSNINFNYGPTFNFPFIWNEKRFLNQTTDVQSSATPINHYILPRGRGLHWDSLNGAQTQQGYGYINGTADNARIYDNLQEYNFSRGQIGRYQPQHQVHKIRVFRRGSAIAQYPTIVEIRSWDGQGYSYRENTEHIGFAIRIPSFELTGQQFDFRKDGEPYNKHFAITFGTQVSTEFMNSYGIPSSNYNHNINFEFLGETYPMPCNVLLGTQTKLDEDVNILISGSRTKSFFEIDT